MRLPMPKEVKENIYSIINKYFKNKYWEGMVDSYFRDKSNLGTGYINLRENKVDKAKLIEYMEMDYVPLTIYIMEKLDKDFSDVIKKLDKDDIYKGVRIKYHCGSL